MNYKVALNNGNTITIPNVATAEKDGSGLRFKDENGSVIASFNDGQASAHWPDTAVIEMPAPAPASQPEE